MDICLGVDIESLDRVLDAVRPFFKTLSKDPANFAKETKELSDILESEAYENWMNILANTKIKNITP